MNKAPVLAGEAINDFEQIFCLKIFIKTLYFEEQERYYKIIFLRIKL
jgi:hypothetical protein